MATNRFPNRNVNVPMNPGAVQAARDRTVTPYTGAPAVYEPADGKGSRRQIAPGQWVDDRVIVQGGPASPSADSPPEQKNVRGEAFSLPASFDAGKVYSVTLGKSVQFCGRWLSPSRDYTMTGEACTEIQPAIIDAVEVGDIPVDPDAQPS